MQRLSKRLQAVSDFVTEGYRLADVGTDHGYVPIALVERGVIPSAIAMDINAGPLARAQAHIRAAGLEQRIETRLSDGLRMLREGEVDSVLLAGMGGMLIIRILDAGSSLVSGLKELVLEPQSDIAGVREYIRNHGLCIDREELVLEDGKFYPVLHAVSAMQAQYAMESEKQLIERLQERLWEAAEGWAENSIRTYLQECSWEAGARQLADQYGCRLIQDRHPLLCQLLARDELRQRKILESLPKPGVSETSDARRREVRNKLMQIRVLREECLEIEV